MHCIALDKSVTPYNGVICYADRCWSNLATMAVIMTSFVFVTLKICIRFWHNKFAAKLAIYLFCLQYRWWRVVIIQWVLMGVPAPIAKVYTTNKGQCLVNYHCFLMVTPHPLIWVHKHITDQHQRLSVLTFACEKQHKVSDFVETACYCHKYCSFPVLNIVQYIRTILQDALVICMQRLARLLAAKRTILT